LVRDDESVLGVYLLVDDLVVPEEVEEEEEEEEEEEAVVVVDWTGGTKLACSTLAAETNLKRSPSSQVMSYVPSGWTAVMAPP